ncbi:MAG: glycerophosphodiester phosphodiesterase [Coprococcus sp.]|nr:glycerophosphodiester phosphodiesterase [Coprococcus sp.]
MSRKVKVIAHRGASALAKHENTLEAFDIAIQIGADMVEFDIRTTKDNIMVVFHDDNINGKRLKELTYQQLNKIAGTMNYHVPTLEQVLDKCRGKIHLDIELKEAGYEERVIEAVKSRYSYHEYSMKSFNRKVVENIKKIDKNIKTGLLVGKEEASIAERVREYFAEGSTLKLGCDFVSPYYKMMTWGFLFRMKKRNLEVYPWTVNKEKSIRRLLRKNIDGIITDRPDIAIQLLKKMKRQ